MIFLSLSIFFLLRLTLAVSFDIFSAFLSTRCWLDLERALSFPTDDSKVTLLMVILITFIFMSNFAFTLSKTLTFLKMLLFFPSGSYFLAASWRVTRFLEMTSILFYILTFDCSKFSTNSASIFVMFLFCRSTLSGLCIIPIARSSPAILTSVF